MSRRADAEKELTEKKLDLLLFGTPGKPQGIRAVGWLCYHTYRPQRSAAGYPDWSCMRERHVYIELKTEKGKTTDEQKKWLRAIIKAGVECYVVRPRNIDDITIVMAARRRTFAKKLDEDWTEGQKLARGQLVYELITELGSDLDVEKIAAL